MAYCLMLPTILAHRLHPIPDMLLDCRKDHQLFSNCMPGKTPGKQILELSLLLGVIGVDEGIVNRLYLLMIFSDGVQDARIHGGGN